MSALAAPVAAFLAELEQEAPATRKLLERLPADRLGWRPHAKSMTLGQLAHHVATTPAIPAMMLSGESLDASNVDFSPTQPATVADVGRAFEDALGSARSTVGGWGAKDLDTVWKFTAGPNVLMAAPKGALLRMLVLSHLYHHRGQLTVYLRMLDVPLPAVYGPSADENPFG